MDAVAEAVKRGKTHDAQAFSHAMQVIAPGFVPASESDIKKVFDPTAHAVRILEHSSWFNDKASIQFIGILGDSAYLFTQPKLAGADDDLFVLASLGDKIGHSSPVKIPFPSFRGYFTSLVSQEDVAAGGLLCYDTKSADLLDAYPVPGVAAAPVGLNPLHFQGANSADKMSFIALFPRFLPLPKGKTFKTGSKLTADVTEVTDWRPAQAWLRGAAYLLEHHNGVPVTHPSATVFDLTDVEFPWHASNLPIPTNIALRHADISLPIDDALHADVCAAIDSLSHDTLRDLGLLMVPAPPLPGAPSNGGGGFNRDDFKAMGKEIASGLSEANQNTKTSSELQHSIEMKRTCAKFRLLFACISADDKLTPADLDPKFVKILNIPQTKSAQKQLVEWIDSAISKARKSDHYKDRSCFWDSRVINECFLNATRGFNWSTSKLASDCAGVTESISLLNFLRPDKHCRDFKVIQQEHTKLASETAVVASLDPNKQVTSVGSQRLFTKGRLLTLHDVLVALRNFRVVCSAIAPDFDKSVLGGAVAKIDAALEDDGGRDCNDELAGLIPPPVHLLLEVQKMLTVCVKIASDTSLVDAVLQDLDIQPSNYNGVANACDKVIQMIDEFKNASGPPPNHMKVFEGVWKALGIPLPPQHSSKRKCGDFGADTMNESLKRLRGPSPAPPKVSFQRPLSPTVPPKSEVRTDLGMFVYKAEAPAVPMAIPPISDARNPGSFERPCSKFFFRGFACLNKKCSQLHIGSWNKISPTDQKILMQFVNDNSKAIMFAHKQGPGGTP